MDVLNFEYKILKIKNRLLLESETIDFSVFVRLKYFRDLQASK